jgi:hypothetical protein
MRTATTVWSERWVQPRVIRVTAMSKLLSSSSSAWRLQQIDAAQIDDDDMAFLDS